MIADIFVANTYIYIKVVGGKRPKTPNNESAAFWSAPYLKRQEADTSFYCKLGQDISLSKCKKKAITNSQINLEKYQKYIGEKIRAYRT